MGNKFGLESILRNLTHNALRYTNRGSVLLAARKRADHWRLEVRDSGIGIPEDKQQVVFNEFIQLGNPERDRENGLGLGLSIVQKLCRLLGYKLQLRSKPESGSVFSVLVPLALENIPDMPLSRLVDSERHVDMEQLSTLEILLLDDDQAVRESIKAMLSSLALQVRVAGHGDAAVMMALEKRPDIMIVDYRLRDYQTGVEAIKAIRDATKVNIPAILLTGDTAPDKLLELFKTGFPVLHKPVSQQTLLMAIQEALRRET